MAWNVTSVALVTVTTPSCVVGPTSPTKLILLVPAIRVSVSIPAVVPSTGPPNVMFAPPGTAPPLVVSMVMLAVMITAVGKLAGLPLVMKSVLRIVVPPVKVTGSRKTKPWKSTAARSVLASDGDQREAVDE